MFYTLLSEPSIDWEHLKANPANTGETSSDTNKSAEVNPEKGDEKPPKKPKPKFTLDLETKSQLQKDQERIALWTRYNYWEFVPGSNEEVENTFCDFDNGITKPQHGETKHNVFEEVNDRGFVCKNWHAILCKDCVEVYSSSEHSDP